MSNCPNIIYFVIENKFIESRIMRNKAFPGKSLWIRTMRPYKEGKIPFKRISDGTNRKTII
jgi:hypothetical protein